jgi:N-acetylglucosaminyl-diphospho-decaprenol L-rhamnosyltransferase
MTSTGSQDIVASSADATYEDPGTVDCVIVIVCYNSARHIERLLDSLPAAAEGLSLLCVVVDNDSQDDTVAIVRARADAVMVEAGRNLGYAGAINLGRSYTNRASPLLVLNPDLVLEPGAIARLYEALDAPNVGIAVPKLLDNEGRLYLSLRREPSPTKSLGEALFGARYPSRPSWLSEIIRDRRAYEHARDVAWAGGAVMLISEACNRDVGAWDDRFFLYSEETDFAMRAWRHGYRVRYVPSALANHEDGGSGRSPELGALLAVNRIRLYEKYHRRPSTSLFRATVVLHYLLRSADPDQRMALKAVSRRSRWSQLPGGSEMEPATRS